MSVPVSQMWTVATYVLRQRLRGREAVSAGADARAAVSLQSGLRGLRQDSASGGDSATEPDARSNALRQSMSAARRWSRSPAASRCCIRRSARSSQGLVARKKYVYLCTNALEARRGAAEVHAVEVPDVLGPHGRPARRARPRRLPRGHVRHRRRARSKRRSSAGFRVTTNTTLFDTADPERIRGFFDEMMELGVEGMMVSPGYSYDKAPDQEHFLQRDANDDAVPQAARRSRRGAGSSTSRRCSWSSSRGTGSSNARRGATRRTTSSAGRSRATCCTKATRRRSRNCSTRPTGSTTAARAATRSAPTAWSTAATSRAPSPRRSAAWRGLLGHGEDHALRPAQRTARYRRSPRRAWPPSRNPCHCARRATAAWNCRC